MAKKATTQRAVKPRRNAKGLLRPFKADPNALGSRFKLTGRDGNKGLVGGVGGLGKPARRVALAGTGGGKGSKGGKGGGNGGKSNDH